MRSMVLPINIRMAPTSTKPHRVRDVIHVVKHVTSITARMIYAMIIPMLSMNPIQKSSAPYFINLNYRGRLLI